MNGRCGWVINGGKPSVGRVRSASTRRLNADRITSSEFFQSACAAQGWTGRLLREVLESGVETEEDPSLRERRQRSKWHIHNYDTSSTPDDSFRIVSRHRA